MAEWIPLALLGAFALFCLGLGWRLGSGERKVLESERDDWKREAGARAEQSEALSDAVDGVAETARDVADAAREPAPRDRRRGLLRAGDRDPPDAPTGGAAGPDGAAPRA